MRMQTMSRYAHLLSLHYVPVHVGSADRREVDSRPESVLVHEEAGRVSLVASLDFQGPDDYQLPLIAAQSLDATHDCVRGYVSIGPALQDNSLHDNNIAPAWLVRHRCSCVATVPVLRRASL